MTKRISTAPAKLFLHRDQKIDRELDNIYSYLRRLNFGPFRVDYDAAGQKLYISIFNENDQQTVSIADIDATTGAVRLKSTLTQSATLGEYARG